MFTQYALVKNNLVTSVINYDYNSGELLEDVLSRFEYDSCVDCSLHPDTYFYIGKEKIKDKFRDPQPYKSWSYDYDLNSWIPPVAYPESSSALYKWDEDSLSWVPCNCDAIKKNEE